MSILPTPCRVRTCAKRGGEHGYCDEHRVLHHRADTDRRGTAAQRGYGNRWRKARVPYLREHPLCRMCMETMGRLTPATVVDHIVPHRGDYSLMWDQDNWQSLCRSCHDIKTREDMSARRVSDNKE